MPRYIDAELLLRKSIQERRFFIYTENLIKGGYDVQTVYNDLAEFVESIPTADVVEVVRCKDCKYFLDEDEWDSLGMCLCERIATNYGGEIYPERDHFCSYGARKK